MRFGSLKPYGIINAHATDKTTSHSVIPLHAQIQTSQCPLKTEAFKVIRDQIQNCSESDSAMLGQTGFLLVCSHPPHLQHLAQM